MRLTEYHLSLDDVIWNGSHVMKQVEHYFCLVFRCTEFKLPPLRLPPQFEPQITPGNLNPGFRFLLSVVWTLILNHPLCRDYTLQFSVFRLPPFILPLVIWIPVSDYPQLQIIPCYLNPGFRLPIEFLLGVLWKRGSNNWGQFETGAQIHGGQSVQITGGNLNKGVIQKRGSK